MQTWFIQVMNKSQLCITLEWILKQNIQWKKQIAEVCIYYHVIFIKFQNKNKIK